MKYAIVKFLSSKDEGYSKGYTYENTIKAKKYDAVIVPTRYGLSLAVVEKLTDSPPADIYSGCGFKKLGEVIQSAEVEKLMREERKKDIKKQLEREVKKLDEIERFKLYAGSSPEFAELLKEYEKL